MKKLSHILLFALSLAALGQSKQWNGTSSLMWPAQAPSALVIDKNGTNTVTINNTNAVTSDTVLLRARQFGTNVMELRPKGDLYLGAGAFSYEELSYPGLVVLNQSDLTGRQTAAFIIESVDNIQSPIIDNSIAILAKTNETTGIRINSGNGFLSLQPTGASAIRLNTESGYAGSLVDLSVNNNTKFRVDASGAIATGDPGGGAGEWKLGTKVTGATVTLVTTNYVEVNINGTAVKLAIVQ